MPRTRRELIGTIAAVVTVAVLLASADPATASSPSPAVASVTGPASTVAGIPVSASVQIAPGFVPSNGERLVGPTPAATPVDAVVGLAPRDPSGWAAYTTAIYLPGTAQYHHFLSTGEFARQFGPTTATIGAATSYFHGEGLAVTVSPDGLLLTVEGNASAVGHAFGTSFQEYAGPSGRTFFSHAIPASLPRIAPWTGAFGLGNVSPLVPLAAPIGGGGASRPSASCSGGTTDLVPCQIWNAYNMTALITNGTDGAGVRLGIVDAYDGHEPQYQLASDLASFDGLYSLPTPTVHYVYPVPTTRDLNVTSNQWGLEEALDLEWAHASAPGASIDMTLSPDAGPGLYASVDWLVAHQAVDVISLSWGEPDVGIYNAYNGPCSSACNASTDGSYGVLSPVLELAAAEGISVFAASGDCGAADGTSGVATNFPASDPFVTGVGGTLLAVTGSGSYLGETGWSGNASGARSPGCSNQGGAGGGFSPFPRPWWQAGGGIPISPSNRGVPDVSMDAATAVNVVEGGSVGGVDGTSLATPLWAGVTAIADQKASGDLGFLAPALYRILDGREYATAFHDVVAGDNGYTAGPGWDPITGIGTPIVGVLVNDLARATPPVSTLAARLFASPALGATPLTVSFAMTAEGGSGTYPLEGVSFGDGNASYAPSGSTRYTYSTSGVYVAEGYVADSSGNTSVTPAVAVVAGGGTALRVTLGVSSATPAIGAPVVLTATVTGGTGPYSYSYQFGDGSSLNWSTAASVTHTFGAVGTYCGEVIVEDSATPVDGGASPGVAVGVGGAPAGGCAFSLSPLVVTPNASVAPRDAPADFPSLFAVSGGPSPPGGVTFRDTWSSTDPYVAACNCALFRAPGAYPVHVVVNDSIGQGAAAETNVTVARPLVGTFQTSRTFGPAPWTVAFSASVVGGFRASASNTSWTFGDGGSATGATASATYGTPGVYLAIGHLADAGHGNASEAFLIDVLPPRSAGPAVSATILPAVDVPAGAPVDFSAAAFNATGAPVAVTVRWNLGNGSSAFGASFTETFEGPFVPGVTAWNGSVTVAGAGFGPSETQPLRLPSFAALDVGGFVPRTDALVVHARGGPTGGYAPLVWVANSTASAPQGASTAWTFGDGNGSANASVTHRYRTGGNFTAVVTATDAWGDRASSGFAVAVRLALPLTVVGGPSTLTGMAPLLVNVTAIVHGGTGAPYTYRWTFGDGASSSLANTSHRYPTAGTFTVGLRINDSGPSVLFENWTIVVASPAVSVGTIGPLSVPEFVLLVAVVVGGLASFRGGRRTHGPNDPPTP